MRTYEKQIEIFGYEIADEVVKRENDKNYQFSLDRFKISQSISKIYEKDLREVSDDLDDQIKKSLKRRKLEK
jgi:hypothetical protein